MRAGFLVALLMAAAPPAAAQACPALHVRNPDGNYIVSGSKADIRYAPDLSLDAYAQHTRRRPSVVVIHGGGWSSGSRIAHVGQLLETLTHGGYHWFSVDYRLAGLEGYESSLGDLRAALAFIRCRGDQLGIDPSQLVLLGEDSGAHLAARLAAERPAGVIGAVLLGGFYDLATLPEALRGSLDQQQLARASPLEHIGTGLPPLLVIHGSADTDAPIDQARRYCTRAAAHGNRCDLIEVRGASHRAENWWPTQWGYKREMIEWLRRLSPSAPRTHRPRRGVVEKDIVFSPLGALKLDAFVPNSRTPVPAAILVHGGGWEAGDKVTYITPLFEPLARAGLAWFSIDYRLTPEVEHDEQIADVRRAIRFVRDHHARFNIDPRRIVLIGESASGQIAAQLAAEDRSLAGVVSFYGVYDFPAMVTDASPRSLLVRLFRRQVLDDEARAVLRRYSPVYTAHAGMPPMLLVNGTGERLWEQAQAFERRLTAIGAPHDLMALAGAPHGMENWEGHPEWTVYKARVVEWIRRVVRIAE
jgi:acetyl esterase